MKELSEKDKDKLRSVIEGKDFEVNFDDWITPSLVDKFLTKEFEFPHFEIESNGWDWDFWLNYSYNDKIYTFHGSGFYGRQSFSVNVDEDEGDINED